jgi:methylation protein EvaC
MPLTDVNRADPPDYLVIFAWSFFDEIRTKNGNYLAKGGRMILPLPEVSIFPPPAP